MSVDWDSIMARVPQDEGQSQEENSTPQTEYDNTRKEFSAFVAERVNNKKETKKTVDTKINELDELTKDVKRAYYGKVGTALDAFGQFETSKEYWDLYNDNAGAAESPVWGELPSGRFLKQTVVEEGLDLGFTIGLAFIPYVGPVLAVADLITQMYGESRKNIVEETGVDQPVAAIVPAAINTGLAALTPVKILKKVGLDGYFQKTLKDVANGDVFKPALKKVSSIMGTGVLEGTTEILENLVNETTVRVLTDENVLNKLTPEEKNEMWGSFWGGLSSGSAVDAVMSGLDRVSTKQLEKDINDTIERDRAILESLTTGKPVKPRVKVNADGTYDLPEDEPNAVAPVKQDDPTAIQQDQRIADAISGLGIEEREIAIKSLENELTNLQTRVDELRGLTSDEATVHTATEMAKEKNDRISVGYSLPTRPEFPAELADSDDKFTQRVNGEIVSLTYEQAQNASGVVLVGNPDIFTQRDFDRADAITEMLTELGLNINPITKQPMVIMNKVSPVKWINGKAQGGSFSPMSEKELYVKLVNVYGESEDAELPNAEYMDEAALHELGHLLATQVLSVVDDNQKARLYNMWSKDLASVDNRTAYVNKFAPSYRGQVRGKITQKDRQGVGLSTYATSLQEYLAEQFMLSFEGKSLLRKESPAAYTGLRKAFTKLHSLVKRNATGPGNAKTFKQFVEFLGTNKQREIAREQLKQMKRDQEAAKSERDKLVIGDLLSDSSATKDKQVTASNLNNIDTDSDGGKTIDFIASVGLEREAENMATLTDINMGFLGTGFFGNTMRKILTPLQMAEQADKKGFTLPTQYMELIQSFQTTKMKIIEKADTRLQELKGLGKDSLNRVSRALYLISTKSDEVKGRLSEEDLQRVFSQLNMTDKEVEQWREMDQFMIEMIDNIESAMLYDAAKIYIKDRGQAKEFRNAYLAANTAEQRGAIIEEFTGQPLVNSDPNSETLLNPLYQATESVIKQIRGMRARNYFPRSRLGEYAVKVVADKGAEWEGVVSPNDNNTIGFYAFDTEQEQREFIKSIAPDMGKGLKATGYKMDSMVYSVMGMPSGMIDQIKRDVTGLTRQQEEQLGDIMLQRSPGRKFLRHLTKRRGVAGYSEDALRVFANYASSASNHVARAEWASDLTEAISDMERHIMNVPGDAAIVNDLNVIKEYFVKHLDYVMRPDNDWARLRAVGFLYYLGFNVKSAAVNFMQTPMVLYPTLSAHTSDANALRRITGALKDAVTAMRGGKSLDDDVMNSIQRMIESGLIDESMVSELAGMAEADGLKRLVPGSDMKSTFDKFAYWGGSMFRIGEKFNRYVATIAAHRVGKDNGLSGEELIRFIRDTIQGSQFEYSRWNRAEFMRGRRSVLFLFWQYMQHANYLLFGGKGSKTATRMWVLALLIAGLEGLPFAELILDFLDLGGTKIKKMLGDPNPRVSLRSDLRELILHIHDKPDDILKGASYTYGLGPLHAASLLGVPVPNVSTRGSLSYGNPVPWFDGMTDPTLSDSTKLLAKTVAAVAGPVGGMGLGVVDAMMSKDPDNWKRWEKVLPLFARNASTGIRWIEQGGETDASKAKILTFSTPEQRAEAALKGLGFQPTRVDQTRQQIRAVQVAVLYTQIRREALMRQLDYAVLTDNKEGIADVKNEIISFNKTLNADNGLAPFKINAASLLRSLKQRNQIRREKEAGVLARKKGIPAQREAERLYPINPQEDQE